MFRLKTSRKRDGITKNWNIISVLLLPPLPQLRDNMSQPIPAKELSSILREARKRGWKGI